MHRWGTLAGAYAIRVGALWGVEVLACLCSVGWRTTGIAARGRVTAGEFKVRNPPHEPFPYCVLRGVWGPEFSGAPFFRRHLQCLLDFLGFLPSVSCNFLFFRFRSTSLLFISTTVFLLTIITHLKMPHRESKQPHANPSPK